MTPPTRDLTALAGQIRVWASALGFSHLGVTGVDLSSDEPHLLNWLAAGRHGSMDYMARHGIRRTQPSALVPGTVRVISVRVDYFPPDGCPPEDVLADPTLAYVSRYALGRDYHRVMRRRLQKLADLIAKRVGPFGYRAFCDSAPVLEKALARNAGLGWIGKHTNLIDAEAGSWFFLGELYTDLPLPVDAASANHCGSCQACLRACPTGAIVAPYQLDARRCIAYLTIEHKGSIPVELRPLVGNRIFGCDDCQLVCPWNRFAKRSRLGEFSPKHELDASALVTLFAWREDEFDKRTRGLAIRRIGYTHWLRNIAVALGNAPTNSGVIASLKARANHPSVLVREHVDWALARHGVSATPQASRSGKLDRTVP